MSHLNDRLAQYIHRVKELELNNNSIQQLVTTLEQTNNKEIITTRRAAVSLNIQEQESRAEQRGEEAIKNVTDSMLHKPLGPSQGACSKRKGKNFCHLLTTGMWPKISRLKNGVPNSNCDTY